MFPGQALSLIQTVPFSESKQRAFGVSLIGQAAFII